MWKSTLKTSFRENFEFNNILIYQDLLFIDINASSCNIKWTYTFYQLDLHVSKWYPLSIIYLNPLHLHCNHVTIYQFPIKYFCHALFLIPYFCHAPNPEIVAKVSFCKSWSLVNFKTISSSKHLKKYIITFAWLANHNLKRIFNMWIKQLKLHTDNVVTHEHRVQNFWHFKYHTSINTFQN